MEIPQGNTLENSGPPYDIAAGEGGGWMIPSDTNLGFANDNVNGGMNFYLGSATDAPSNVGANAAIGIVFFPPPTPFLGIANVVVNGPLYMEGHAECGPTGIGHTEGSVGWIVLELDTYGNITRWVEETYSEQYYNDVNFGQASSVNINTQYSSQTSFVTLQNRFYEIYVWLLGNITASGNEGLDWSAAAGYGGAFPSVNRRGMERF